MGQNWVRVLKVKLKQDLGGGKGREVVFGDNFPNYDLQIEVEVNKYMSALKDNALIKISNLTYSEVINIVNGQYYSVEIIAGYQDGNQMCVFKGAILRISNTLNFSRTNIISILCGSNLIARYSQKFLNFSLKSGMNTYSAIKFLSARAGIKNGNISEQFKKDFIQQVQTETKTIGSYLESLTTNNPSFIVNADSSSGSTFSIYDARKSNNRVINLANAQFIAKVPSLNSSGLNFTLMPVFDFMCGDVVLIDNAIISLSAVDSIDNVTSQPGYYLDTSNEGSSLGAYVIINITYTLCNRSSEFSCNITAKARSLLSNFIGV